MNKNEKPDPKTFYEKYKRHENGHIVTDVDAIKALNEYGNALIEYELGEINSKLAFISGYIQGLGEFLHNKLV